MIDTHNIALLPTVASIAKTHLRCEETCKLGYAWNEKESALPNGDLTAGNQPKKGGTRCREQVHRKVQM